MSNTTSDTTEESNATTAPRKPLRKRPLFRLTFLIVITYAVFLVAIFFYQDKLLFPADIAPDPSPLLYNAKTVQLEQDIDTGGKTVAWFVPAPGLTADKPAPLVIYCHGNAEIIDYQHTVIDGYQQIGCSVLLPEYRGYGRADGKPSEEAIVADAIRFYDEIVKRSDVDASRVFIHGRSMGGGVAAGLAANRKPPVLILESTFASVRAMAKKYYAPACLVTNPFRTDLVLEELDVPVLIFHGTRDNVIPVSHGRTLRDIAKHGTYVEYDCKHNDFPGDANWEAYWLEISRFLSDNDIIIKSKNDIIHSNNDITKANPA